MKASKENRVTYISKKKKKRERERYLIVKHLLDIWDTKVLHSKVKKKNRSSTTTKTEIENSMGYNKERV